MHTGCHDWCGETKQVVLVVHKGQKLRLLLRLLLPLLLLLLCINIYAMAVLQAVLPLLLALQLVLLLCWVLHLATAAAAVGTAAALAAAATAPGVIAAAGVTCYLTWQGRCHNVVATCGQKQAGTKGALNTQNCAWAAATISCMYVCASGSMITTCFCQAQLCTPVAFRMGMSL
jgi:hypothetical protein